MTAVRGRTFSTMGQAFTPLFVTGGRIILPRERTYVVPVGGAVAAGSGRIRAVPDAGRVYRVPGEDRTDVDW